MSWQRRSEELDALVAYAAEITEVPREYICSAMRQATPTLVRHAIWYVLREQGWRFVEIAAAFDRDHSSILHGIRRTGLRMRVDPDMLVLVEALATYARRRAVAP